MDYRCYYIYVLFHLISMCIFCCLVMQYTITFVDVTVWANNKDLSLHDCIEEGGPTTLWPIRPEFLPLIIFPTLYGIRESLREIEKERGSDTPDRQANREGNKDMIEGGSKGRICVSIGGSKRLGSCACHALYGVYNEFSYVVMSVTLLPALS